MAYCGPAGIPYTTFIGGPAGWDDLSRDAAIAWQLERDTRCGGCGQHRDEWVTLGADGQEREIRPAPYVIHDHHCPSCETLERARKAREKEERPGQHLVFVPKPADTDADPASPGSDLI